MSRAMVLVLDSLGVGALPDAPAYGDEGANTLGHIAEWCARPKGEGGRGRALAIPNLVSLGLGEAARLACGRPLPGLGGAVDPHAMHGCARERSRGKDTVSGHWELCGLPVPWDWGLFPQREHTLTPGELARLADACGVPGFLGNRHASGTQVINDLGAEHLRTGLPILYFSADSVIQIAAHEEAFGLARLLEACAGARRLADEWRIGRVIARPFTGDAERGFTRTPNRRDYAVPPPEPTLLDLLGQAGGEVVAVGKIRDIFAGRGIGRAVGAHGLEALVEASLAAFAGARDQTLVFTNLVDFDQEFGHRRDVAGYADALERFDAMLPRLRAALGPDDVLVLVADHGNDPTWPGSDHTREHIPFLAWGPGLRGGDAGVRASFADAGQSLAAWFGLPPLAHGRAAF
ncbi:phosphopentomutase [Arenimonas caeni]|uniref:Phosphopentomutase n=1 Tax=Arenimonas caeni TaxID=2058085 RepID=A0A2P6M6Q2_9GAMM|nr:phosphopentomutase [Arenimonas caeni]PRH81656.1 phosphopentomutase [Arenimonas caeni]